MGARWVVGWVLGQGAALRSTRGPPTLVPLVLRVHGLAWVFVLFGSMAAPCRLI